MSTTLIYAAESGSPSTNVGTDQTELYRHYDSDGDLLYVGVSLSTVQRLMHHRGVSKWFDQIARIDIERFATRGEALDAERRAIRDESPIYNRAHRAPKSEAQIEFEESMAALTPKDWEWLRRED